jgi:hypothetical protein
LSIVAVVTATELGVNVKLAIAGPPEASACGPKGTQGDTAAWRPPLGAPDGLTCTGGARTPTTAPLTRNIRTTNAAMVQFRIRYQPPVSPLAVIDGSTDLHYKNLVKLRVTLRGTEVGRREN